MLSLVLGIALLTAAARAAMDGGRNQKCEDPIVCPSMHSYGLFKQDWADVRAQMGHFLPGVRSPCWKRHGVTHCLPAFFIGGFPKCGTTTLFSQLSLHPELEPSRIKEPHWWTRANIGERIFAQYLAVWRDRTEAIVAENKLAFEGSASTVWDRGLRNKRLAGMLPGEALHRLLPDAKMLVAVRDPAERAWSEYRFFLSMKADRITVEGFHDAVVDAIGKWEACRVAYPLEVCLHGRRINALVPRLNVGMYAAYLELWRRYYPPSQLFVVASEEMARQPQNVLGGIFAFLNVSQPSPDVMDAMMHTENRNINPIGRRLTPRNETMQLLRDFYRPFNQRFAAMMQAYNLSEFTVDYNAFY